MKNNPCYCTLHYQGLFPNFKSMIYFVAVLHLCPHGRNQWPLYHICWKQDYNSQLDSVYIITSYFVGFTLILSSHVCLSFLSGLFFSGFLTKVVNILSQALTRTKLCPSSLTANFYGFPALNTDMFNFCS